ncbi:unnamed protein product [Caretta caretta]
MVVGVEQELTCPLVSGVSGLGEELSAQKALRKMRVNEKEKKWERGKGGSDGSRQRWRKASEKEAAAGEEDKKTNLENNSCPTWMVNAGI